jgi:hypothetical protein
LQKADIADYDTACRFSCENVKTTTLPLGVHQCVHNIHVPDLDQQFKENFKKQEYLSLGSLCHASMLLKNIGYKKRSYPFDWIFSNPEMVIECLKDDFKTFLDKSYYIHRHSKQCGHSLYHPHMFNHRNPLKNEEDHLYHTRCVHRFRELSSQRKCFVVMLVNLTTETDTNYWTKWNQSLSELVNNYVLVVISHRTGACRSFETVDKDNVRFINVTTLTVSNGTGFGTKEDNAFLHNKLFETI